MFTVKLLTEAEIELTEACKWYESKRAGLGSAFLKEINYYLNLIGKNPLHFAVRFSEKHRFAVLRKFPYFIVFRIEENGGIVYVISIFNTSRNPVNF